MTSTTSVTGSATDPTLNSDLPFESESTAASVGSETFDSGSDSEFTTDSASTTDSDSDSDSTTGGPDPLDPCPALPPPSGNILEVTPDQASELAQIVLDAPAGTTILLNDGVYALGSGPLLHFFKPDMSLRSKNGDPLAVVLDGEYGVGELVLVQASGVTIADITLQRAFWHPIHVTGAPDHTIEDTRIYNVRIIDPGQQAIKINASQDMYFSDSGLIACSQVLMTDDGRSHVENCYTGGIDAHSARDWVIRDNYFEGFWCAAGLSEHAVHFWITGRDTLVERNSIVDCARGIGFGLGENGNGKSREYGDDPCPGADYLGHIDGVIRNNMIFAGRPELFASEFGVDSGIALEQACGTEVYHNSIVALQQPFVSMEYRWPNTQATIHNNLVTHTITARNNGQASLEGNIDGASLEHFVDAANGQIHLTPTSSAIDSGIVLQAGLADDDFDGDLRDNTPDVGADEVVSP